MAVVRINGIIYLNAVDDSIVFPLLDDLDRQKIPYSKSSYSIHTEFVSSIEYRISVLWEYAQSIKKDSIAYKHLRIEKFKE